MSDMVERAARAIAEAPETHAHWGGRPVRYEDLFLKQKDALVSLARLVVVAALDPEDEALVRKGAARLKKALDDMKGDYVSKDEVARLLIKHSITALKDVAQGVTDGCG